jgi:hypothetical protein
MNVAKNVEVANLGAVECEDRHPRPPYVTAAWRHTENLLTMKPVETHLSTYPVLFFDQREDVGRLLAESPRYPVNIPSKFVIADKGRSE